MGSIPIIIYLKYTNYGEPGQTYILITALAPCTTYRFFVIVFNRRYLIQRGLKKRNFKINKLPKLRFGTIGLYCLYSFRFEYRYFLFFRKFFKRIVKRRKRKARTLQRRKTWLFIRPNYTLTHKSKNARMGKGKGNFKRWCTIVHPGRVFIEHLNAPSNNYKRYALKMQIKTKLFLRIISKNRFILKHPVATSSFSHNSNKLQFVRLRKQLYSSITHLKT